MTANQNVRWMSVYLCSMFLLGCSSEDGEPTFPVSGTITQKGKPVEGAIVAFTPTAAGLPASGVSDALGVYKLTTKASGDGAVAGKYNVSVAKYDKKLEPKSPATPGKLTDPNDITDEYSAGYNEMTAAEVAAAVSKNLLPPKYANPATSKLEADVSKGDNKFDFKVD